MNVYSFKIRDGFIDVVASSEKVARKFVPCDCLLVGVNEAYTDALPEGMTLVYRKNDSGVFETGFKGSTKGYIPQ